MSQAENRTNEGQIVNVARYLSEMALTQPYRKAVIYPAHRHPSGRMAYTHLTFRQLDRESDCLAHGMTKTGLSSGTRTILMVKPSLEFFVLVFALFKAGIVPVVVDPGMGVGRMLSCLKESRAQALIGIPPAHVLRTIYPKYFKSVRTWITVGRRWFWGGLTLAHLRALPWKPYDQINTRESDTAAILFTTGSTGPAKGAVYTHGVFDAQIKHIKSHFRIQPGEVDLPTFPLFALFDPALGMTAVIPEMDPTRPALVNPNRILEAILNHGVTNMFASPALLNRVGRFGQRMGVKLPTLKRVVSAGAPVAAANIERFTAMLEDDAEIHTPYGATEAVPIISIGSNEILNETRQLSDQGFGYCIGRPLENLDIRIIKINDAPILQWSDDLTLPPGEIGEIAVRGDLVTRKYFRRPEADALAKIDDNDAIWHRMGDLGWQDNKGRIWFCGRKSHRVVTVEETLFTIPCEAIFNVHPDVYRSALVGIGPRSDQIPVICIELEKGVSIRARSRIRKELLDTASENPLTQNIQHILFHKSFPVDIRHNSKIFREKLAVWAAKKIQI
jgi:acyl-CoA synthetase (AMP-forming)/AMP-acid ligase II